ncbi:MAG: TetR/AcrR family transcriptional regulator C-terminal domain-containing protein [Thaumarchaeota archaeon]|nr:TetR/AcrR family transcriptional regulator C-terminal domain-containing protein [Nitrososphaerota archaeon]
MKIRPKKQHIDPEEVVKAAIELLDAEGLDQITLRQLASKFEVQPPALYWHFKDKQDLVDDMAQSILKASGLDEIGLPEDTVAWAEWLTSVAYSMRRALLSHRDGGRVVAGASFFRAKSLARLGVLTIAVLNRAGFDPLHANLGAGTVFDYVWGYVIEEQAGYGPEVDLANLANLTKKIEVPSPFGLFDQYGLDPEALARDRQKLTPDAMFDWGLQLIITGLKSALKESRKSSTK